MNKDRLLEAINKAPTLKNVLDFAERHMGEPLSETDKKGIIGLVEEHGAAYIQSHLHVYANVYMEFDDPNMAHYLRAMGHSSLTEAIKKGMEEG